MNHRFEQFPTLTSDALTLRQVMASDAPAIREISFYDGLPASSNEHAIAMLERIEHDCAQGESLHWGICRAGSNEIVGTCGYYRGFPGNVGELGYVLRERYRGRGIMTAALRLVIHFGQTRLALAGIVAYTDRQNRGSIAVLQRLGFTQTDADGETLKFAL